MSRATALAILHEPRPKVPFTAELRLQSKGQMLRHLYAALAELEDRD